MSLCKYRNIFGKVGKGIHSYRIANIAVVDVALTVLAAYIIHLWLSKYSFMTILVTLLLASIPIHHIFCVRTPIDKLLFS